jgi:hypothetical protein
VVFDSDFLAAGSCSFYARLDRGSSPLSWSRLLDHNHGSNCKELARSQMGAFIIDSVEKVAPTLQAVSYAQGIRRAFGIVVCPAVWQKHWPMFEICGCSSIPAMSSILVAALLNAVSDSLMPASWSCKGRNPPASSCWNLLSM